MLRRLSWLDESGLKLSDALLQKADLQSHLASFEQEIVDVEFHYWASSPKFLSEATTSPME